MVYSAISTRPGQRNGINGGEKGYTWWRSPAGGEPKREDSGSGEEAEQRESVRRLTREIYRPEN